MIKTLDNPVFYEVTSLLLPLLSIMDDDYFFKSRMCFNIHLTPQQFEHLKTSDPTKSDCAKAVIMLYSRPVRKKVLSILFASQSFCGSVGRCAIVGNYSVWIQMSK